MEQVLWTIYSSKSSTGKSRRISSTKMTRFWPSRTSPRGAGPFPGHPEKHIRTLNDLTEEDKALAGHILFTAQRLAVEQGCEEGFRVVMNCNPKGGQTVYHIHMHVLGQRQMHWPPG
jgi:hypothetical protein